MCYRLVILLYFPMGKKAGIRQVARRQEGTKKSLLSFLRRGFSLVSALYPRGLLWHFVALTLPLFLKEKEKTCDLAWEMGPCQFPLQWHSVQMTLCSMDTQHPPPLCAKWFHFRIEKQLTAHSWPCLTLGWEECVWSLHTLLGQPRAYQGHREGWVGLQKVTGYFISICLFIPYFFGQQC